MDDVSPFVTHFARLVGLLVHEPDDHEGQKEELRCALTHLSSHPAALSLNEIASVVSAAAGEGRATDSWRQAGDLAMRMASHSVRTILFEAASPAREVLDVARALADDPVPGDEGASFDEHLVSLALTGVTVHLGASGFVRRAVSGGVPAYAGPVRTPAASVMAIPRTPARKEPSSGGPASESQAMMQVQLMRLGAPGEGVAALLDRLDRGIEAPNVQAIVDDVARATEDLAGRSRFEDMVHVLARLHQHYDRLHDGDTKRALLMGIRRLQRPALMHGVARLLPARRELREIGAVILVAAGEVGADALIDNLIRSEVANERRAYLDVLKQCPAAVNSLLHLLSDDRWYVVRNAVALLGELGATVADRRLAELVSHREPRVRRALATALGKLGTTKALLALLQTMNDPSPDVRLTAAHAIADSRNPRAVPWLIEALDHEQEPEVQAAIYSALGRAPTEDGVARLVRAAEAGGLLVRRPAALRLRAIEALSEAGTPSARRALEDLLQDRDREVRSAVERAVSRKN